VYCGCEDRFRFHEHFLHCSFPWAWQWINNPSGGEPTAPGFARTWLEKALRKNKGKKKKAVKLGEELS
jgi:hypothetical protein